MVGEASATCRPGRCPLDHGLILLSHSLVAVLRKSVRWACAFRTVLTEAGLSRAMLHAVRLLIRQCCVVPESVLFYQPG